MRTPAGKECRHYHEDFHRGRNVQECRLIKNNPDSIAWKPVDCDTCPIPEILNANADPNMDLIVTVASRLLGLGRKITVTARCHKHQIPIKDPYVGCTQCNNEKGPALDLFRQALDGNDD
jgi:hypothetical protein